MSDRSRYNYVRADDLELGVEGREPSLYYAGLCREYYVLAEAANASGSISDCVHALLSTQQFANQGDYYKRADKSGQFTMERFSIKYYEDYTFHACICDPFSDDYTPAHELKPLVFIVLADQDLSIVRAFSFLQDLVTYVYEQYKQSPGIPQRGLQGSLDRDLKVHIIKLLKEWSSGVVSPEVQQAMNQIQTVQNIMLTNIDELIQRKDRIDILVNKTEELENDSISFRRTAKTVQDKEWWRNNKILIIAASAVSAFVCIPILISYI